MKPVCLNCRTGIEGEPIPVQYEIYIVNPTVRVEQWIDPKTKRVHGSDSHRGTLLCKGSVCSEQCKEEFLKQREAMADQRFHAS